jgi:hypothetical protein
MDRLPSSNSLEREFAQERRPRAQIPRRARVRAQFVAEAGHGDLYLRTALRTASGDQRREPVEKFDPIHERVGSWISTIGSSGGVSSTR